MSWEDFRAWAQDQSTAITLILTALAIILGTFAIIQGSKRLERRRQRQRVAAALAPEMDRNIHAVLAQHCHHPWFRGFIRKQGTIALFQRPSPILTPVEAGYITGVLGVPLHDQVHASLAADLPLLPHRERRIVEDHYISVGNIRRTPTQQLTSVDAVRFLQAARHILGSKDVVCRFLRAAGDDARARNLETVFRAVLGADAPLVFY